MKRKNPVVIFGSGGHAKVILDILKESGEYILGFLDENKERINKEILGYQVLGDWSYIKNKKLINIALGIGDNKKRYKLFKQVENHGLQVVNAIHPHSYISSFVRLGKGIVIMPNAVVNPGVTINDGVIINTGATVDHDCNLGKFSHVCPGVNLAGTVKIGEFSFIGVGSSIIQNIKIGKNVTIGAGASVINDIRDNVTAVGVPAKVIKKL